MMMLHIFLVNQFDQTFWSCKKAQPTWWLIEFFLELAKDLWDKRDYHNLINLEDVKN